MIISAPRLRHDDITTSEGSASDVLSSQPGPLIPASARTALSRPPSSRRRNFQTTDTATMLVTTGR